MPTGKVKWFDKDKGFGFLTTTDGDDVFLPGNVLPPQVNDIKAGTRVEFGIATGKKGPQALSLRVLEAPSSVVKATRKPADEMVPIIEDVIKLLDDTASTMRRGRYPDKGSTDKLAALLRAVADNLDGAR